MTGVFPYRSYPKSLHCVLDTVLVPNLAPEACLFSVLVVCKVVHAAQELEVLVWLRQ